MLIFDIQNKATRYNIFKKQISWWRSAHWEAKSGEENPAAITIINNYN